MVSPRCGPRLRPRSGSLGVMYAVGQGVPQDLARVHMWFSLAAAQGDESATKNQDISARRMTPAQIAQAQKLVREWKPKSGMSDGSR